MEAKDDKYKKVYLAIIFSLLVHAILLAVFYFIPLQQEDEEESGEVEVETVDREEMPDLEELLELHQTEGEELRSVVAKRGAERTEQVRSYQRKSQEEVQREIDEELKSLEQEVIDELRDQGKGFDEEKFRKKNQEQQEDLEDYGYINKNEGSYSNATVEYELGDRDHLRLPIPSYKCVGRGTVVIDIDVDREGKITSASVNSEASSNASDCHREQALAYAQRSLFYNDSSAPRRQQGTITYKFFSQ